MLDPKVVNAIEEQIKSCRIFLYMKGTPEMPQCGFSQQVVACLRECGAKFDYLNILEHPNLRQNLKEYASWPTFPQLYVNGELLGGCDIVLEMAQAGELALALEVA